MAEKKTEDARDSEPVDTDIRHENFSYQTFFFFLSCSFVFLFLFSKQQIKLIGFGVVSLGEDKLISRLSKLY